MSYLKRLHYPRHFFFRDPVYRCPGMQYQKISYASEGKPFTSISHAPTTNVVVIDQGLAQDKGLIIIPIRIN